MFGKRKCSTDSMTDCDYANYKVKNWYYLTIIIDLFYINFNNIIWMIKNDLKNTTELLRKPNIYKLLNHYFEIEKNNE